MFLCHKCLRRTYGRNAALIAAVCLALAVLAFGGSWRLFQTDTTHSLFSWFTALFFVGAGLLTLTWNFVKDALSTERDPAEGQQAALRILQKRNARGPGVVYWTPKKGEDGTAGG
jgi:protein-S-isoprenylcysteine O-methyltransferase Ste14